jgi:hypothetical protein
MPDLPDRGDSTMPVPPDMPSTAESVDGVGANPAMTVDASLASNTSNAGVAGAPNSPLPARPDPTFTAEPLTPPAPATPAAGEVATPVEAPVATGTRRGAVARGGLRFIQFAFGVGLFVFGIWIGMQVFQSAQKPTDAVGATAVSNGVPTPPVVQEFAHALQTGGPDAVRSSVSPDVFSLLAYEVQRWNYATITKVDVLSTAVDGPRTATGLILTGTTTDGRTMWINLIVHTDNGQISTLR